MTFFNCLHRPRIVGVITHTTFLAELFPVFLRRWVVFQNDDEGRFSVVINDEEQYSIWPEIRDVPAGWHKTGFTGSKEMCVAHIDEVWTDMRPASLRLAMAGDDAERP